MPASGATSTVRPASTFSVGSLSGVPGFLLAQAASTATAIRASGARRRLLLGRIVVSLGKAGAVVELRHGVAGLRRVDREAVLLALEFGDREFLDLALLLAAQRRDTRHEAADTRVELGNALGELLLARGLVALGLGDRGVAGADLLEVVVDEADLLLRVPGAARELARQVPGQRTGGE